MNVPVAETARRAGRSRRGGSVLTLAGLLVAGAVHAETPVPGGGTPGFAEAGQASYQVNGTQAYVNQVGDKSILNWKSFNISPGHDVQFRQVQDLATNTLVPGASFTSLNRIHDINPSVIAGSISQAAGQKANVILVNSNGIAFMGGAQVNLNSFTASTLNVQDKFILENFLPGGGDPQFEKALDGGEARGFVKVFEGARISAGKFGRVMLIAPTVVNRGTITAPDGRIIAAAASKLYLRALGSDLVVEVDSPAGLAGYDVANPDVKDGVLDGQAVGLGNAPDDMLGNVTNLGELTSPRGNVTMIGYAVNQTGIARATTSVVSGGSIYLLAQDTATDLSRTDIGPTSTRAGRVIVGDGSVTEIMPDTADTSTSQDGSAGTGLDSPSRIRIFGQDVRVQDAVIRAPAGRIEIVAADSEQAADLKRPGGTLYDAQAATSEQARIHIAKGAVVDVSGLRDVAVAAGRSVAQIDLRSDELKDSPVNRDGPIRGAKTVNIDVDRALDNAQAGKPTLVAQDTLQGLKAQQQRTVAERSTSGGSVSVHSQGEVIIEDGARIDLSGGSLDHAAGFLKTTLLSAAGKLVDISDAPSDLRYDGIASRYVREFGRWNRQEIIDLGETYSYRTAYTEGRDAGALDVFGIGGVYAANPDIVGRTTVGERQRELGIQPRQAQVTFGYNFVGEGVDRNEVAVGQGRVQDYKLNQQVTIDRISTAPMLPAGFKFGDALPAHLKNTLNFNAGLIAPDKVGELTVFNNQDIAVKTAIQAPQGGAVLLTGSNIDVQHDMRADAGTIALTAENTATRAPGVLAAPRVEIGDGVSLSVRGAWVNDTPGTSPAPVAVPRVDGGALRVVARSMAGGVGAYDAEGQVVLGAGARFDADGGAWVRASGKSAAGKGGEIRIEGHAVQGLDDATLHAFGVGKGGTLVLGANRIQVGGTPLGAADAIDLDPGFFSAGGFADFTLAALDRVEVADNTVLRPALLSRELDSTAAIRPTGADPRDFSQLVVRDARVRQGVNLNFKAGQKTALTGDARIGEGARIEVDPGARVSVDALRLATIEGTVRAAGGTISVRSGVTQEAGKLKAVDVEPGNVWLGDRAVLDASGTALTYRDAAGRVLGTVLDGGTVDIAARGVVSRAGSTIDVSGAAATRLDVPNESGGIGRQIASDAGSVSVFAGDGAVLDGEMTAQAGAAGQRGGRFAFTLNTYSEPGAGATAPQQVLSIAPALSPRADGMTPITRVTGETRLDAARLEAAGFDRVRLASADALRLENGVDMGAGRAVPLRELTLDAASLLTGGGAAAVTAETVRIGNYDAARKPASAAPASSGTLTVNARQLELAGAVVVDGMAQATFNATEEIRLTGPLVKGNRLSGELKSNADLVFHGATVAPATYAAYAIRAPGRTVSFTGGGSSAREPWSAFGRLEVEARDIVQGGAIWAPFGQIDLRAEDTLTLVDGSLTSVAASSGNLLPFGKLLNGRDWVYDLTPQEPGSQKLAFAELPEKSIRTRGDKIDMQPGARVSVAGGGDVQAYEFTVGPGGSRDILSDPHTYAIVPAYGGGYAPLDAQEGPGFDRQAGDAVYLSGVPGLRNGVYILLPAHYALLPGAYAIRLDPGGGAVLPGQGYLREDGVRVAPGYLTDTRVNAPRDARWQGVQVLSRAQVLARSEMSFARASAFFAGRGSRPQDAGLLSIVANGVGADALRFDANFSMAAAAGGRSGALDLSAKKLALTSGPTPGLAPDAVVDVRKLNRLGARSLLIGGTRERTGATTSLDVSAETVTLANDADHALKADEIILAASDTLTLKSGSVIDAQGHTGDAVHYEAAGNGALVRAGATPARFNRTGGPDRSRGTLTGERGSTIRSTDSVTLDATLKNAYAGDVAFERQGRSVPGKLAIGAPRINLGTAPAGSDGLSYSQSALNALSELDALSVTSYTTFDVYGDVRVGAVDPGGKPLLRSLVLQGAGIAGIDNAGQTAEIRAQHVTLANPSNATFVSGGAPGSGTLEVRADTLTLGGGVKTIVGYSGVKVAANELIAGNGKGSLRVEAPLRLDVSRISGDKGGDQDVEATAALTVARRVADRALAPVTALGARWALSGTRVDLDSQIELPSGSLKVTATGTAPGDDVTLGSHARVDVAGRGVQFFDVSRPAWGGTAAFVSQGGDVRFETGARVDVSGAAGGDAGNLIVKAVQGSVTLAANSVQGKTPAGADSARGAGARVDVDTGTLAHYGDLNSALNQGGFDGERRLRVRSGDVDIAAGDVSVARDILIAVDGGKLDVAGELDASGQDAGRIALYARDDVTLKAGAKLTSTASRAGEKGGDIEIGTSKGFVDIARGSQINVGGGAGGTGGRLRLRAPRTATNVNVTALDGTVTGARSLEIEAVKIYDHRGDTTLTTADLDMLRSDGIDFATHHDAIKWRLGKSGDSIFHILTGAEIRSDSPLTLGSDWNLKDLRAGSEAGVLTLRAAGHLNINANLSDGFSAASGGTLLTDDSWSYRLAGGADQGAADPLAVSGKGDVVVASGKLVRTGTGDIRVAAGRDIAFQDQGSVIYTAGRLADAVSGFTPPAAILGAVFSQNGGNVDLRAAANISGAPGTQRFSEWLYRQGAVVERTGLYDKQPAWWVRFDQFRQGVGALGGGDVAVKAGGSISDLSASAPTQGRVTGNAPANAALVQTGGGNISVEAAGDIRGGQYYSGRGGIMLAAGRDVADSGGNAPFAALGDAQVRVRAGGDAVLGNAVTPHLLAQSAGNLKTQFPLLPTPVRSAFSTFGADSAVVVETLAGKASVAQSTGPLGDASDTDTRMLLPSRLAVTSFQGDVSVGEVGKDTHLTLNPSPVGGINLVAAGNVQLHNSLTLSDMDPALIPSALAPEYNTTTALSKTGTSLRKLIVNPVAPGDTPDLHAVRPVHAGDRTIARVYAVSGDVTGINEDANQPRVLDVSKPLAVKAGRDVRDFSTYIQHNAAGQRSVIEAGRDVAFGSSADRRELARIRIGGPGTLEVTAGRNIDLGTSGGIVTRGNNDNPNLPSGGAALRVAAGVGERGIDYRGAVDRLLAKLTAGSPDEATLWQARWLTGDPSLGASDALAAVRAVAALQDARLRDQVREMLFTALRETGRAANLATSGYANDFSRGYNTLALVFPGIEDKSAAGAFERYQGDVNLFASRLYSEQGGGIDIIAPGGRVVVGLPNTPEALIKPRFGGPIGALGVVVASDGDIRGVARDDVLVNQSRVLTVGGGDVLLWSSEGDLDAGKGKKTASTVPPPLVRIDGKGNVTQELRGAVSGSGIGALASPGVTAGDVDLIAPRGAVNAGDAGIRAGNLNIAAQVVIGADNISVTGTSTGTPVADTSAVTAAASGASNPDSGASDAIAALERNVADAARAAESLKNAFRPTFISAEVIGHGE